MQRPMIISVDFDGTIVKHAFPDIGEPLPLVFETLKDLQSQLGAILVLNTCREDEERAYLTEAIEFCKNNGIEFDSINENLKKHDFRNGVARKVFADCYIDDRNFGGFPGWQAIRDYFQL